MPRTWRIVLKTLQGLPFSELLIDAEEVPGGVKNPTSPRDGDPASEERMTEPQKRYLFRLLAAQGVEGKKAEEHLKSYFRVSRLPEITRAAASAYIDQLVKDRKEAAGGSA